MKPQAYTEFQPLKEVLVGRSYDKEYLEKIRAPFSQETKRLMNYLLDETEEDYQILIDTLLKLDVKVVRAEKNVYHTAKKESYPFLANPRDDQIVIDNKIIFGHWSYTQGKATREILKDYREHFLPDPAFNRINCPSIVRLGEDIIVDTSRYGNDKKIAKRLEKYFKPLGYNIIHTITHDFKFANNQAHSDAVFAILKPGCILHANYDSSYYAQGIFPGWDMCKVPKEKEALKFHKNWVEIKTESRKKVSYNFEDGKYSDDQWKHLLNTWFTDWVGFSKETFFDLNCLVVDESNVIFSGYNKEIFKFCEKHKINPIICPFRHRFFWDGGTHCITLDLKRSGSREKYL